MFETNPTTRERIGFYLESFSEKDLEILLAKAEEINLNAAKKLVFSLPR